MLEYERALGFEGGVGRDVCQCLSLCVGEFNCVCMSK